MRSALRSCVLAERSGLGRTLASGADILDLLQRLCTADVACLAPGGGKPAVLTTPKGRIVQRLWVYNLGPRGVLLVSGPAGSATVQAHIDRYTFGERTGLADMTLEWKQFALIGPKARETAAGAELPVPPGCGCAEGKLAGDPILLLGGDGLSPEGLSVVVPSDRATRVREALLRAVGGAGGCFADDEAVEAWRVLRGLPEHGHELTEEHNPLEAGLWDAVSFRKGCYVGQEVVARLNTYDKVARQLRGLALPEGAPLPAVGAALCAGEHPVGAITSAVLPPGRRAPVAMAYVKRDHAATGTELTLEEDVAGRALVVVDLPFGETA